MLIWPDMQAGVALFFAMATQWRWAGAGMAGAFKTGLDYSALKDTAEGLKIEYTPQVFRDVQVLEEAALSAWAERRR